MTALIPLGIISAVATFIIGMMGGFPVPGFNPDLDTAQSQPPIQEAETAGEVFTGM